MPANPEDQLAEFLMSLPTFVQKLLWRDQDMSQLEVFDWMQSVVPFSEDRIRELEKTIGWSPTTISIDEPALRREFESILRLCAPEKWKKYRRNSEISAKKQAEFFVPTPRNKAGRKRKTDLAEKICELHEEGKTAVQINGILNAEGIYLSLSGVESYFKNRRKTQK